LDVRQTKVCRISESKAVSPDTSGLPPRSKEET
jgi:hypothetical protein